MLQESLANAKGSARQPWYIVRNSLNRPPLRIAQQYQRNLHRVPEKKTSHFNFRHNFAFC